MLKLEKIDNFKMSNAYDINTTELQTIVNYTAAKNGGDICSPGALYDVACLFYKYGIMRGFNMCKNRAKRRKKAL